jgi:hypothetical protein
VYSVEDIAARYANPGCNVTRLMDQMRRATDYDGQQHYSLSGAVEPCQPREVRNMAAYRSAKPDMGALEIWTKHKDSITFDYRLWCRI